MNEQKGCKRKERRTISSRLTNLRPTKRKACKIYLPSACSLKDKFPPVYCQHWGNCTSNAVLGCDDMIYHNDGKWVPSTTFTYYNQKKNEKPMVDDGSFVELALKKVKKFGACSAKIWANDEPWNEKPSEEAYADGFRGKGIKAWYEVKSLKQVKQAIASGYPVAAAVAWCFKDYDEKYIMNIPTEDEARRCHSGHAIVYVGYDDNSKLIEFRNSSSDQWANEGYAFMTYETLKRVAWWDDTYAVTR